MTMFVAGVSYKTAPVEIREKLATPPGWLRCRGCQLKIGAGLSELVVLSTCNRVELYGVTSGAKVNLDRLFGYFGMSAAQLQPYIYVHEGAAAAEHLFRVASGLDSMVLGETEITGQVKDAYQNAQAARLTGKVLNRLFQTALQTAKAIRTETQVGRGATSVGSVAVELAEKIFDGELAPHAVLIIGAGKMGEACVRHLAKKGVREVWVANRSREKSEALAAEIGGRAVEFADRYQAMAEVDIVVSSTGAPQVILEKERLEEVMRQRRQRPLFLVDIAVPRDIDPAAQAIENLFLYDIDDLETLVRENLRLREQELAQCQAILHEKTAALMARLAPSIAPRIEPGAPLPPAWEWEGAVA